jgi:RHS repeat-associated protein
MNSRLNAARSRAWLGLGERRGMRPHATSLALFGALFVASTTAHADSPVVTKYTYDPGDHVTTVTDPRGLVTAYNYDGLGQLWGVSSPDTGITTTNYDAYGRRSSLTRANNATTTYSYDAISRLASISAGGQTHTFGYDSCTNGLGRLCSVSDAIGSIAYSYTREGWIAGRGFSISGTTYALGYSYDALGHLATVTYPDGHQATYSYSEGAVSGITFTIGSTQLSAASNVTWRPMDAALTSWTSSNGLTNTLAYDTDGRLTGISVPGVESLGYSYDSANRVIGINNVLDGTLSQNFGYDDQSRLVWMNSAIQSASYSYDANGNRITSVTAAGTSNTGYSATSNRLVSTTGANAQSYGYDELGNLTTLGGTTAFQYDAFNRMSAAGGSTYYVNPEGQRLAKTGGAGTTYFAPDAGGPLLAEYANGAWIDYVWLGGRLIGREVNGQLEAIHNDQLGRPQVVTDASQAVVWSAQNWPFARSVAVSNSVPLNLGFPGQYYDAETGLWNNGFRDYDPTLGRYVESDPLGMSGGINTYLYAAGNPISLSDSTGLCPSKQCQDALATAGQTYDAIVRAMAAWPTIEAAASIYNVDPALIAAIGVRETGFQNIAQYGGGLGRGVFQIDLGANPQISESEAYNVPLSAEIAGSMLARNMESIASHHSNLSRGQITQATAASYNFGVVNISGNPNTIDVGTTHNNYGGNVKNLMSCFPF